MRIVWDGAARGNVTPNERSISTTSRITASDFHSWIRSKESRTGSIKLNVNEARQKAVVISSRSFITSEFNWNCWQCLKSGNENISFKGCHFQRTSQITFSLVRIYIPQLRRRSERYNFIQTAFSVLLSIFGNTWKGGPRLAEQTAWHDKIWSNSNLFRVISAVSNRLGEAMQRQQPINMTYCLQSTG